MFIFLTNKVEMYDMCEFGFLIMEPALCSVPSDIHAAK
jgi:hypothetical protein